MAKVPVGILGATGTIGKKLYQTLENHPWFEVTTLIGRNIDDNHPCRLIFSAVSGDSAKEIETNLAKRGYGVISSASAHRFEPFVPMMIPEVNEHHLQWIKNQTHFPGFIITKPNCSVVGITLAMKPLLDHFGLDKMQITTCQSRSGAGKKGSELDLDDNIIPYIASEEEKIESEPNKILDSNISISATATRVPVTDGHLAICHFSLKNKAKNQDIIDVWNNFPSLSLPSAPSKPLLYLNELDQPQPKIYRERENGMGVTIGRLRFCPLFGYKCIILTHNTIRGGAGGAILTAELLYEKDLL
ncbi:aspartate-semialdehyde dehydrogenase [Chlamydiales bacterium]|nr:aspartate-semialdehyde dehydrogenase [Chlamydiales bacterium]